MKNGERAEYRPDLVSSVFKLHLAELLNDIKNRHVLGVPVAELVVLSLTIDILYHIMQVSFKSHINIKACASVKSVKYLFKYVYKGHDCANMEMVVDQPNSTDELNDMEKNLEHDEIAAYLNCRYISAPEAIW